MSTSPDRSASDARYLYSISTVAAVWMLVHVSKHWRLNTDSFALVPVDQYEAEFARDVSETADSSVGPDAIPAEVPEMPDLLTHVVVPFTIAALLGLRYD